MTSNIMGNPRITVAQSRHIESPVTVIQLISKGQFTPVAYNDISIAITIRLKKGLCTYFAITIPTVAM